MFTQKPTIEFITFDWVARTEYPVKPANEFLPEVWKKIPLEKQTDVGSYKTVKACPGIGDWLTMGYIIPAWSDIVLKNTEYGPDVTLSNHDGAASHSPSECSGLLYTKSHYGGSIKLPCKWMIKTAPGWSIMIVPLWYHENLPIEAMPGIIHSDTHHTEVNFNFILKTEEEFRIKAGTPLVKVIPFKRQDVDAVSRAARDIDVKRHNTWLKIQHSVTNALGKFYRKKVRYNLKQQDLDFESSLKFPLDDHSINK